MATAKDLQSLSDQEVVALARAGKEVAYRELLHRYERPVFSLIYRMVRDRATSEDLSQETFVKVLNALDSYRPEYRFSSWIFKIANNAAIDHLRKRELHTLSLDGAPDAVTASEVEATALQATDHTPSALAELESRELGTAIEQAVAKLRPDYRACILLRHVEGRAYEEIAEALDLPLGTVKTYIHRARLELREHLAHLKDE
jgi:RNA polymerase sigma-70 factor (ECF subfamily)